MLNGWKCIRKTALTQKGPIKMIKVERKNGEDFEVTVSEQDSSTVHLVTLDNGYYQALTKGATAKEDFIKSCFKFLLQRESKESILSRFNVRIINKYFPEFEEQIKTRTDWAGLDFSRRDFLDNQIRLQVFALVYNLGDFLRRLGYWMTLSARFVKRDSDWLQFEGDFNIFMELQGLVA